MAMNASAASTSTSVKAARARLEVMNMSAVMFTTT
jgi:hypothetical protein